MQTPGIDAYKSSFARIYDVVMRDVNYPAWAGHIVNLCEAFDLPHKSVLNLACGTGTLDSLLAPEGLEITGVDISPHMVELARAKAAQQGYPASYHVSPMQSVRLERQFDLVICLYDSLNYITEEDEVIAAIESAHVHTRPGGGFIFDVTTEHNIVHNFAQYTFAENFPEFSYIWENEYVLRSKLCRSLLTVFTRREDGLFERDTEEHVQRMYTTRSLSRWLKGAGFRVHGMFEGLTMDAVTPRSERIHFVCERK